MAATSTHPGPPGRVPIIYDSGATNNYEGIDGNAVNVKPDHNPVRIKGVSGDGVQSTHVGEVNILGLEHLPSSAKITRLFPELKDIALMSVGQMADHGCISIFYSDRVEVIHNGKLVLTGTRNADTNQVYYIDQDGVPEITDENAVELAMRAINQSASAKDMVAFHHQSFFSPCIGTLKRALRNNYITNVPELTAETLQRHRPLTKATVKGHLNRRRKNLQSTKTKQKQPRQTMELDEWIPTILEEDTTSDSCFVALIDAPTHEQTGKAYSDQTGRFPVTSSSGNTQLFVLYHYDANHIFLLAIKNKSQECLHAAYTKVHEQIKAAGLKLNFQIMDNECSQLLKEYMTKSEIDFQLVPPANHRANAAERAIQTAKHHFIAGLCTCPSNFPLNQWDKLVPQAELTLNLMRGSRMNPKQSAWEQVHGHYDYNRTPIAPPGMNVMI
jgi:hypothetical protein